MLKSLKAGTRKPNVNAEQELQPKALSHHPIRKLVTTMSICHSLYVKNDDDDEDYS